MTLATESVPEPAQQAEAPLVSPEDVERLLASLPEVQQDIMRRFYLQEEPVQAIADATQLSAGTVKSHLHRARLQLARNHQAEAWQ